MAGNNITHLNVIERIFSNWTALRMAVEHGMGNQDRAHNFCEFVAETLNMNERLHYTDISMELEDYMDSEFNTRLEDESEKQVAEEICRFHNYFLLNDMETLATEFEKLPPLKPWIIPNSNFKMPKPVKNDEDDSENSDSDEGDNRESDGMSDSNEKSTGKTNSGMEVDEDGWSVIRRKKK